MTELREIPGWGVYRAGSDGHIYGHQGTPIRERVNNTGHLTVTLYPSPGVRASAAVHRLIALAFVPNPKGLPVVRHKDDTPSNNVPGNLEWGTLSDNSRDMVERGRHFNASKTHCPQNHPYDEENTLVSTDGFRRCYTCQREQWRASKRRRRAAIMKEVAI